MEMVQTSPAKRAERRSAGWRQEETEKLLCAARDAGAAGQPLRSVFEAMAQELGRKPNSIRNHYYACVREGLEDAPARSQAVRPFTPEETHDLLRRVLTAKGQGVSVRACVMEMAGGDRSLMLRYQNKYRTLMKRRPEMLRAVAEELTNEGVPCPALDKAEEADAAFCDPASTSAARLMAEPCIASLLEGLKELLRRAARAEEADNRLHQLDRLRVEHDLQRLNWEKDFDEATCRLDACLALLREFLALPADSQVLQLGAFRDAAAHILGEGEAFLTRVSH